MAADVLLGAMTFRLSGIANASRRPGASSIRLSPKFQSRTGNKSASAQQRSANRCLRNRDEFSYVASRPEDIDLK
jgi:hypothetical protein